MHSGLQYPTDKSAHSPDIADVSNDDSSVDSSPHVEISESKGGIWPDHSNVIVTMPMTVLHQVQM